MAEMIRSQCNACANETEHDVIDQRAHESKAGDTVLRTEFKTVVCRGCKDTAVRIERIFFDYIPEPGNQGRTVNVEYQPPRLWHRPPSWFESLEEIDPDLKGLMDEVYSVCNDQQTRLLSMGVRAVLDRAMTLILGGDTGTFEQKLDEMVEAGYLAKMQRDNLAVVIDAGSASTHRGYKPATELVREMVVVMEGIVRDYYFTGPMLQIAKTQIPPRPPVRKKT